MNDFSHFYNIENYEKCKNHPVFYDLNINKYYPNLVFMHYDTIKEDVIHSLIRKIERTKNILLSNEMKTFIYYIHYYYRTCYCTDLETIIEESLEFCNMYINKYNKNFILLSLITYDSKTDIKIIHESISKIREKETDNLKFDFVFRRDDENIEINNISINSWDIIYNKLKNNSYNKINN